MEFTPAQESGLGSHRRGLVTKDQIQLFRIVFYFLRIWATPWPRPAPSFIPQTQMSTWCHSWGLLMNTAIIATDSSSGSAIGNLGCGTRRVTQKLSSCDLIKETRVENNKADHGSAALDAQDFQ